MVFGEMALLDTHRSANVVAETSVSCLEVLIRDFDHFREDHPQIGERIMRNLARLLAERLIVANNRVNVLTNNDRDTASAAAANGPSGVPATAS
jgi:glutaminase